MADESRTSEELTQLVRECVRSEMELQRSGRQGNTNLLSRTRDLIASSARSASRDVANSVMPSQSQTAQHVLASTTNTTQTTFSRNSPDSRYFTLERALSIYLLSITLYTRLYVSLCCVTNKS